MGTSFTPCAMKFKGNRFGVGEATIAPTAHSILADSLPPEPQPPKRRAEVGLSTEDCECACPWHCE